MIEAFERFIAYICPDCSSISDCIINVFDFSGNNKLELKCLDKYCKTPAITLSMKNDKMKLDIHCPVCTEMHSFTISKNAFWSKDLVTFTCPGSGIDIFFAGEERQVVDAVNENERLLDESNDMMDDLSGELSLILQTLDCLHEVLEDKRLICNCGSRNLFPVINSDKIYVECSDCGKKFPITPSESLINLLITTDGDFKL